MPKEEVEEMLTKAWVVEHSRGWRRNLMTCPARHDCGPRGVDAASFLTAASKGSLYLKHIFDQHASVKDANGERLMNQSDFFNAVKHTKWTERDEKGRKIVTPVGETPKTALNDSSLKLMFHLADQSGDNLISLSEFILLYSLLQAPFTKYQMAFKMFDQDNSGLIDREEFIQVVKSLSEDPTIQKVDLTTDPFIIELFGKPNGKKGAVKQLTYAEFESLLSRDVLPSFLSSVSRDLKQINRYWEEVDLAFSPSYAGGEGLMSGFALSASVQSKSGFAGIGSSISWKSLVAGGIAGAVSRPSSRHSGV
ncbi:MAG: EF-hand domain-containing protein [Candidatus Pacebacteria bacterium]|nr:EF-hand domain-containing protein [Candidatus Paceibacterota bacterium]